MEYLESTMETPVFEILICRNFFAQTTNKYCDFDATLLCSCGRIMQLAMLEIKDTK